MNVLRSLCLILILLSGANLNAQEITSSNWQEYLKISDSLSAINQNDSSILILESILDVAENDIDSQDTLKAGILWRVGLRFIKVKAYTEAESTLKQCLEIRESDFPENQEGISKCYYAIAGIYFAQNDFVQAQQYFQAALNIQKSIYGPESHELLNILFNLAKSFYRENDYKNAINYYKDAVAIADQHFGSNNIEVSKYKNNLALAYSDDHQYDKAEILFKEVLKIRERDLEPNDPNLAFTIQCMAHMYSNKGSLIEAEPYYIQDLKLKRQIYGIDNPIYIRCVSNFGMMSYKTGNYFKSEYYLLEALRLWENLKGPKSEEVVHILIPLGALYRTLRDYKRAEPVVLRAVDICKNDPTLQKSKLPGSLNELGLLYDAQSKNQEAVLVFEELNQTLANELDSINSNLAISLSNLALVYSKQDKLNDAKLLYERSLNLNRIKYGENHPKVAQNLINLSDVYIRLGEYNEADSITNIALNIFSTNYGPEHPYIASAYRDLAYVYFNQKKYKKAETYCREALKIDESVYGPDQYATSDDYYYLALIYRALGNYSLALEMSNEGFDIKYSEFCNNIAILNEYDALSYIDQLRETLDLSLTLYSHMASDSSATTTDVSEIMLSSIGLIYEEILERNNYIAIESDPKTEELSRKYRDAVYCLSKKSTTTTEGDLKQHFREIDSLQNQVNNLEKDLTLANENIAKGIFDRRVNKGEISGSLPQNSAYLVYFKYGLRSIDAQDIVDHYMAQGITSDGLTKILDLGPAQPIDSIIIKYNQHMIKVANQESMPLESDLGEFKDYANSLYKALIKPFEEVLIGNELLFLTTDGEINMIPFSSLVDNDGKYLIERFPIHNLSSPRDLLLRNNAKTNNSGLLAIGNPDFNASPEARLGAQIEIPKKSKSEYDIFATRSSRFGDGDFQQLLVGPLAGSAEEISMIFKDWKGSGYDSATVFQGASASEDNFKRLAPGKKVIHLATHGYYFEGLKQEPTSLDESEIVPYYNPLLLSGLLFAGSNLHGEGVDSVDLEDGILSAYEVSAMNLSGVDLVVLSGCETGLGKIERGEGVYGLRRAFLMAGAKTVVSSLWQVPDRETAEMLGSIYEFSDISIYDRLRSAQLAIIKKMRDEGLPDHPYLWAGFIAIGDWH